MGFFCLITFLIIIFFHNKFFVVENKMLHFDKKKFLKIGIEIKIFIFFSYFEERQLSFFSPIPGKIKGKFKFI